MTNEQWEPLALAYQDMIFRLAYGVLYNQQDAQDVTQDVLLKLLKSQEQFQDDEHARAWLIRVTINRCRDLLRSPWRRRRAELPEQLSFTSTEQTEDSLAVLEAVKKLPPKLRLVIHLYYFEQYDTPEIATLTNQSPSAVRQQLSRARKHLKEQLKEAWL